MCYISGMMLSLQSAVGHVGWLGGDDDMPTDRVSSRDAAAGPSAASPSAGWSSRNLGEMTLLGFGLPRPPKSGPGSGRGKLGIFRNIFEKEHSSSPARYVQRCRRSYRHSYFYCAKQGKEQPVSQPCQHGTPDRRFARGSLGAPALMALSGPSRAGSSGPGLTQGFPWNAGAWAQASRQCGTTEV